MSDLRSRQDEGLFWVLGAGAMTVALDLLLLGWNTEKSNTPSGGECTGPYESWQVITLASGLALVVAVAAWRENAWLAAVTCTVCTTIMWSLDAATVDDPCQVGASLWPIGAVLVCVSSIGGLAIVAAVAGLARSRIRTSTGSSSHTR